MPKLHTFFSSFLVMTTMALFPVQAEKLEFLVSDHDVKQLLAIYGKFNFDQAWSSVIDESNQINEENRAALSQKVIETFSAIADYLPQDCQLLPDIMKSIKVSKESKYNSKTFNDILCQDCFNTLGSIDTWRVCSSLLKNIAQAICTYLEKDAITARLEANSDATKRHLHLFLKIEYDTIYQTITLQTAPNAAQDRLNKIYTNDQLQNWLDQDIVKTCKKMPSLCPEKSCCFFLIKSCGLLAVIMGIMVAMDFQLSDYLT